MTNKAKVTPVADDTAEAVTAEVTFSAKDLAAECDTDPKTFRRWLRSQTSDRANKGGRWVFTAESKAEFVAAYKARGAAKAVEAKLPDADSDS